MITRFEGGGKTVLPLLSIDFLGVLWYNGNINNKILIQEYFMKSKTEISGGTVFVLVVIMGVIFGGIAMATNSSSSRSTSTTGSSSSTTYNSTPKFYQDDEDEEEEKEDVVTWKCYDATSYNRNANDDNRCVSSKGDVRYVGDCEAKQLDPDYEDSNRGAYYYNPC